MVSGRAHHEEDEGHEVGNYKGYHRVRKLKRHDRHAGPARGQAGFAHPEMGDP